MSYVDGFLLPIPKANIEAYRAMADKAGKVWKEHGALAYMESVIDDANIPNMLSFNEVIKPADDEIIIFAYIVFNSREHRDEVNAKVMVDPRLECDPENMPFDFKKMAYGGFKALVSY